MQRIHPLVPYPLRSRAFERARGFTLIELLVVAAIIVVVSGVILANNSRFGGVIVLENLAYDMGLSIRQAQVYGISVARFGQNTFSAGYGIHLDLSSPQTYALFADVYPSPDGDGMFEASQGELVQAVNLNQGYRITDLCITPASSTEVCGQTSSVDILFKRPEPDAWISAGGNSCTLGTASCEARVRVVVQSPRGDTMNIVVDANGQISVRKGITQ